MIDLHYWSTPNGWKIAIALEEMGLAYRVVPVNIARGEQFQPEFLAISPNNRIPAIVDHDPPDGGAPISVFESGAILEYLADKTQRFMPRDLRARTRVMQWVFWQVGGQGPMMGQWNHFARYAPEKIPYAIDRYAKETNRLAGVMDRALAQSPYLAGDEYTIADIATWPWASLLKGMDQRVEDFAHLSRWLDEVGARDAVKRGRAVGKDLATQVANDEEAKKVLFGQTAKLPGTKP